MCGCNKSVSTVTSYYYPTNVDNTGLCIVTKDTLEMLKNQLDCLIKKQDFTRLKEMEVLIGLGNVTSMLNLNRYCMFDVNMYINLFQTYGCSW